MCTFMAGATTTGARVTSSTVVSRSSAIPCASLASRLAVAGAISIKSAVSASVMCPISDSWVRSNVSVETGLPDRVCKVSGVMNSCAFLVITPLTVASALTSRRTISADL